MNRIEEKAHPYADEIPQMEICDTEAVVPGQQKSDSITTHNDSQGSHQCRRNETFVFFVNILPTNLYDQFKFSICSVFYNLIYHSKR